ncbi:aquaporin-7-like isoform X2 [Anneissia japonica]|uniref:aquaporin-7-like isoform X2 n=1 Tax=Anneissia japonica TaxID=1529436 RepID=UPI001425725E|nr:aquaporin-7-like isoform X2 [Anneissia japonica]
MGLWYEAWIKNCSCANPPNQEDNQKSWKLTFCRKFVSEFIGMFAFVFIASGTVASATFYNFKDGSSKNTTYDSSDILYINLGISFGYSIALYICIENVGYLNVALTLVFWVLGKMKAKDIIPYVLAQFVGAFLAASCIYGLYKAEIKHYIDQPTTSLIFSSSVNGDHFWKALIDQALKTGIFTIGVMAIIDEQKNKQQDDSLSTEHNEPLKTIKPSKRFEPLMIGLILFLVGIAFSYYARFYFNPLQDLSGLIVVAWAELSKTKWWVFAQIFGPIAGAFIAAIIYILLIENNHPKRGIAARESDAGEEHYLAAPHRSSSEHES